MVNKLIFGLASIGLAFASAASTYSVTFYQPVVVNGAKLKPGDYKVEVDGSKATIKRGSTTTQAAVKVENSDEKFKANSVRLEGDQVSEIRIGGTHTRLVFEKNSGVATN